MGKVYAREVNLTSKAMKQTEKVTSAPERGVATSSDGAAAGAEQDEGRELSAQKASLTSVKTT